MSEYTRLEDTVAYQNPSTYGSVEKDKARDSLLDNDTRDDSNFHIQNRLRRRHSWLSYCPGLAYNDINDNEDINSAKSRRLLDRDAPFSQSYGRMNIRKRIQKTEWRALYGADMFHSLVDAPTFKCIMLLLTAYMGVIWMFAVGYYYIARCYDCNLGIVNIGEAFFFSIETMATVGYGTSDIYFDDCWTVGVLLSLQVCVKLIADALTIGIIYCRLARPTRRASTILFTDKAVIRRIRGKLYFMFQLCELRKHQLAEAHVRCYAIRRDRDLFSGNLTHFQTCSMRLNHPDDELGAMLLLCLPQTVVHEISPWSPLMPPARWRSDQGAHSWNPISSKLDMVKNQEGAEHRVGQSSRGVGVGLGMQSEILADTNKYNNSSSHASNTSGSARKREERDGHIVFEKQKDNSNNNNSDTDVLQIQVEARLQASLNRNGNGNGCNNDGYDGNLPQKLSEADEWSYNHSFPNVLQRPVPSIYPSSSNSTNMTNMNLNDNNDKNIHGENEINTVGVDTIKSSSIAAPSSSNSNSSSSSNSSNGNNSNHGEGSKKRSSWFSSSKKSDTINNLTTSTSSSSSSSGSVPSTAAGLSQPQKPRTPIIEELSVSPQRRTTGYRQASNKNTFTASNQNDNNNNSNNNNNNNNNIKDNDTLYQEEKEMVISYMNDRRIEVVVIIEGVDATTGGTVQARMSYTVDEIEWDQMFPPCVREDRDGAALIDFSLFHDLIPVSPDTSAPGAFSSNA